MKREKDQFVIVDKSGVTGHRVKSPEGDLYLGSHIYEPETGESPLATGETDEEFARGVASMDRIVAEMGRLGHTDITSEDAIDDLFRIIHQE